MRILILNGPNLNLLGTRQPEVYGKTTLPELDAMCMAKAEELGMQVECRQSNHEGQLIDWIQEAKGVFQGLLINAGGYTHTSVALHDAIASVEIPTVELHISNIKERESFRHHSYIEFVAFKSIMGHGPEGYLMGLDAMKAHLS